VTSADEADSRARRVVAAVDSSPEVAGLDAAREGIARRLVERLAGQVTSDTETVVLGGPAAKQLAALARERDADEIVVGSRGLGRFSAALGSVSHALLRHADHPVVVVRQAAAAGGARGRKRARCRPGDVTARATSRAGDRGRGRCPRRR
jgi:nucleotide-binding universal stress UspA family protein